MNRSFGIIVAAILIAAAGIAFLVQQRASAPAPTGNPVESTVPAVGAVAPTERAEGVRYDARGVAIGGVEPNPSGGTPLDIDNIIAHHDAVMIVSRDEADTFTVPLPGDPEWADYLEYRRAFRTSLDSTPGFVVAYDPEWRSQVTGVRSAPDPDFDLFGGASSLRDLLQNVLDLLAENDEQGMVDLALRKEEFEIICWPAFPQSRPYLRFKWEEAWGFHYAGILGGIKAGIRDGGGRKLQLSSVAYGEVKDFGLFEVYDDVRVGAVDQETGETIEFTFIDSAIERNGVFKVFIYAD